MILRPPLRSVLDTLAAEDRLSDQDVEALRAAAPAYAVGETTPWYLHAVMVGVSWLAAPCIAAAPFGLTQSDEAHAFIGLSGCIAACVARRFFRHQLVLHLLLAFSVTFQLVAVIGIAEALDEGWGAATVCAAMFTTLFFVYPDPVHRVVVALGALTATILAGADADWPFVLEGHTILTLLGAGLLWAPATPRAQGKGGALARPAALGLLIAGLICGALCGTELFRSELDHELEHALRPMPTGIALWVLLGVLVVIRLRQHGRALASPATLATLLGVAALAVAAPDRVLLPAALGALLLAYHARDPIGLAFGVVALLLDLTLLWADTDLPALPRAFSLLGTGAVLAVVSWVLRRRAAAPARRSA